MNDINKFLDTLFPTGFFQQRTLAEISEERESALTKATTTQLEPVLVLISCLIKEHAICFQL